MRRNPCQADDTHRNIYCSHVGIKKQNTDLWGQTWVNTFRGQRNCERQQVSPYGFVRNHGHNVKASNTAGFPLKEAVDTLMRMKMTQAHVVSSFSPLHIVYSEVVADK